MSEHRVKEVSKLKGPEHHLDLYTFMAVGAVSFSRDN